MVETTITPGFKFLSTKNLVDRMSNAQLKQPGIQNMNKKENKIKTPYVSHQAQTPTKHLWRK